MERNRLEEGGRGRHGPKTSLTAIEEKEYDDKERLQAKQQISYVAYICISTCLLLLTFRHRAFFILGQAFHYSPENAFYIFNQKIYFITWYLLDRASLI